MKFPSLHSLSALSLLALTVGVGCGQQAGSSSSSSEHTGSTSQALSTGVVISAIYGAGGATGATPKYKNDYVELFNRGATPVSLAGMSLQYATTRKSDTDLSNGAWNVSVLPGDTIPPGGYYLIKVFTPTGTPAGGDLPTPVDFDGTGGAAGADAGFIANYGTSSGLVAIVNKTTALTCANPAVPDGGAAPTAACDDPAVVDFVGYGAGATASGATAPPRLFEGSAAAPTPGTSTTGPNNILQRKDGGCTETDNNGADFEVNSFSTAGVVARNSASPTHLCSIDAGVPDAAIDVAVDTGTLPVDTGTPDTGTSPADTGPADTGTAPTDTGPADTGTAPADTGTATDGGADAPGDTGTTPSDTGTEEDTGTEPADTGTEPADTGTNPQADTGSDQDSGVPTEEVVEDDGCGCRVAGSSHESSMAGGLAALALAGVLARRRRR